MHIRRPTSSASMISHHSGVSQASQHSVIRYDLAAPTNLAPIPQESSQLPEDRTMKELSRGSSPSSGIYVPNYNKPFELNPKHRRYLPYLPEVELFKLPSNLQDADTVAIPEAGRSAELLENERLSRKNRNMIIIGKNLYHNQAPKSPIGPGMAFIIETAYSDIMDDLDNITTRFKPVYMAKLRDKLYDLVTRPAEIPQYISLYNRLLNLRQETKERMKNSSESIELPPRWPSRKQSFNITHYKLAAVTYREDVMQYLAMIRGHQINETMSQEDPDDMSDITGSAHNSKCDQTVTIPGKYPNSFMDNRRPPHSITESSTNSGQAPTESPPESLSRHKTPKTGKTHIYVPPVSDIITGLDDTKLSQSSSRNAPTPEPSSPHESLLTTDTLYVPDANKINTEHTMTKLYPGYKGEQLYFRKHRDGTYERTSGPDESGVVAYSRKLDPDIPYYVLENGKMVPYSIQKHPWDAEQWFLRGDGRYQTFRLPGDTRAVGIWPSSHTEENKLITKGKEPEQISDGLPPPLIPTVLPPARRRTITLIDPKDSKNPETSTAGSGNRRHPWSSRFAENLPASPTHKPVSISNPVPTRVITIDEVPEVPEVLETPSTRTFKEPPQDQSTPKKSSIKKHVSMSTLR